jgi:hypothetical protein
MIYRVTGFPAVVWLLHASFLSFLAFVCAVFELTDGRGGRGWRRSQIRRPQEGLVLYTHSILPDEHQQLTWDWEYHSMIPYHLKSIDSLPHRHIHTRRQWEEFKNVHIISLPPRNAHIVIKIGFLKWNFCFG